MAFKILLEKYPGDKKFRKFHYTSRWNRASLFRFHCFEKKRLDHFFPNQEVYWRSEAYDKLHTRFTETSSEIPGHTSCWIRRLWGRPSCPCSILLSKIKSSTWTIFQSWLTSKKIFEIYTVLKKDFHLNFTIFRSFTAKRSLMWAQICKHKTANLFIFVARTAVLFFALPVVWNDLISDLTIFLAPQLLEQPYCNFF